MRIIGLTGSIACGKTTVSSYLVSLGFPVVDGDRLSRELTAPGSPALDSIIQAFGPQVLYEDGTLNRRRLGQLVFRDPTARETLDTLMAPFLWSLTTRRIEEIRSFGASLCFLDMPLLFEKGYDRLCDSVWTVWLPEKIQVSRLMARDGFTQEEAFQRIRAVLSSDEKAARADRVIDNSGSPEQTRYIVSGFLSEERNLAERAAHSRQAPEEEISPASFRMERPDAAKSRKTPRRSAWRIPVWLKWTLIAFAVLLAVGVTAYSLMQGYLAECENKHKAEQEHIDNHYLLLYRDLIEKYAGEYNLSPAFVSSIIRNESSFQAMVESGAGARGLMQLMPDTAEWIAGKLHVSGYAFERMFDPESNIQFGCWYLNYLSRMFLGDPVAVTAAYHAGQGQVKVWLSDPLLSEDGYSLPLSSLPEGPTKKYAERVTRDYGIYQKKYFSPDQLPAVSDPPVSSGL